VKSKVVGIIAVLGGCLILIDWFLTEKYIDPAYQTSHDIGAFFALVLIIVGLYFYIRKPIQ